MRNRIVKAKEFWSLEDTQVVFVYADLVLNSEMHLTLKWYDIKNFITLKEFINANWVLSVDKGRL